MSTVTPNATMSGAIKAYVETLGLGLPGYRDGAPVGDDGAPATSWPYFTVQEGIGYAADPHGDTDDPDAHDGTTELVQLDLWQQARGAPRGAHAANAERYALPSQLEHALRHGRRGIAERAPWQVYGVRVQTGQRWPISDNVVRHTWTIAVRRDTQRRA